MKIKSISCTQFAGIRDKSISLCDGINVIYGKNESGKSTLAELISRTLFQNIKIDKRSDKEFSDLYFPAVKKGSNIVSDFADGKISFTTESGDYTLTKEWGADPRCMLSTPDGVIRDADTAEQILRELLVYTEGVYTNLLLTSQKNTDASLKTLLDAAQGNADKRELSDAVTVAFAESDGISVDTIGSAIDRRINEIAGAHWDSERNMPQRKAGRWASGLGSILKAYYELEDAKAVIQETERLEAEADRSAAQYSEKSQEALLREAEYENFSRFAGRLALQSERRAKIKKLEAELCRTASLLSEWPRMADELKLAQSLSKEKAERELTDKYNAAKKLYDELSEYTSRLDGKVCPDADDISAAKAASAAIIRLENELCGMNISAKIKMLGGNRLEVRSLRTGELLDGSGEDIAITEAVSLIIPDVAQILLSPADVDTVSIAKQAEKQRADLDGIYEKYGVDTVDGLEQLAQEYAQLKSSVDAYGMRLSAVLGDTEIDELEASVKSITASPRAGDEIAYQIKQLCGETELSRFIARLEALIAKNESDHGSIDMLKEKALDIKSELERSQASLECGSDIPEEYMLISDPEAHTAKLKQLFELSRQEKERALSAKASAASALEAYRSTLEDEPVSVLEQAKIGFAEQKELLDHWLGIKEAFEKQKSELTDSPMNDIAQKFTHYLGEISQGGIYSEFPDADKLDMNIYSNDRLLSYGKLSEGTKETVSLAFRLAVLDHLFPDGGAVVVFDDPLTDMDAERSARSCEMIKDFASRHQVIFLTCKEEYFDMLGGNKIIM